MLRGTCYSICKKILNQGEGLILSPFSFCRIFYQLSGKITFQVGKTSFLCRKDEIVVLKNDLSGKLLSSSSEGGEEFYELCISPEYIHLLSGDQNDLSECFHEKEVHSHIIASIEVTMMINNLMKRLLKLTDDGAYGIELFEQASLLMLLVQVNRGYLETEHQQKTEKKKRWMLDDIFSFIEENMDREILLDEIAARFYVSKYHISKEFKKQTGVTLHSYIVKRKLSYCKELIEQGLPIIEVYKLGGFGEYSHFFRAFKKEFHITPKQYYRLKSASKTF